ncbi:hypothetical protein PINS_up002994 [Pythium insidiosum]|nr:hypothetical protein PINS_up002994 [Pythium insidiosum]
MMATRQDALPAVRASSLSPTKGSSDKDAKDGASPSISPSARRPQSPSAAAPGAGAGVRGIDACLHLANTYYALRMVLVTLFSYILFVALGLYLGGMSSIVSWVAFGTVNFLLIVSALPVVQLYSVEDIVAPSSTDGASGARPLQRLTSFSMLRSQVEEIETRLKPFRLRRSVVLRIGETLVILQVFFLAMLFVAVASLLFMFSSNIVEDLATTRQVLAAVAAMCLILQTTSFDKLRAYQQLQLGAGLEPEQLHVNTGGRRRPASSNGTVLSTSDSRESHQALRQQRSRVESNFSADGSLDIGDAARIVGKRATARAIQRCD